MVREIVSTGGVIRYQCVMINHSITAYQLLGYTIYNSYLSILILYIGYVLLL